MPPARTPLSPEAEVLRTQREGIQPCNHKLTVAECLKRWLVLQEEIQRHGDGRTMDTGARPRSIGSPRSAPAMIPTI